MNKELLPAIVVVAFDRPKSLDRILKTISKANYECKQSVTLIISIDKSDCQEVGKIAREFLWKHGDKCVIEHTENIGLRKHIIACGDLTSKYGAVIILEDDLLVSPEFYTYAVKAVDFYADQNNISGISLYSYDFNEYAECRFIPVEDGFDNYFIQTASSWGQAWTYQQWQSFKEWYLECQDFIEDGDYMPQKLFEWPKSSWKKYFIKYMILHKKYFAYPRVSLSTNSGESGVNHRGSLNYQVPLQLGSKKYAFSKLENSSAIYDAYYELESRCLIKFNNCLSTTEFECDLCGTKILSSIKSAYLLSIKECRNPIASYGLTLIPPELNVIFNLTGQHITLGKTTDFEDVESAKVVAQLKFLHKNLGWKRYAMILKQTILNRIRKIKVTHK